MGLIRCATVWSLKHNLELQDFFIWLGKPYAHKKGKEQCKYPIKYEHRGDTARQSVCDGGNIYCVLMYGTPLAPRQSCEDLYYPILEMKKVRLREVKNVPKYNIFPLLKAKRALMSRRFSPLFCNGPIGCLQTLLDPSFQVAGLSAS